MSTPNAPGTPDEPGEVVISVASLFGARLRKPFVDVTFADVTADQSSRYQISPAEARRVAMLLLECAESADHDANVFRFFAGLGMGEDVCSRMLVEFRQLRNQRDQESDAARGVFGPKPGGVPGQ